MKTAIAWIIHSILPAWIAKFFIEVPSMSDETPVVVPTVEPAVLVPAPVQDNAAVVMASQASACVDPPLAKLLSPAVPAVNTDTLKALLLTLGHDIEAEWDHLVALAKKL